ncbi:efflux RND transporter periplasmic adaptor subunit [Sporosarcina sp. G11-34]|uniref:efflux RND transporter periplasmic adaptor subunit n=1 Tax=Sporosarcina sp. G11-34 TaxID=2849605 RepID=UPI0022A8FAA7|nr:biotin/lipoyl-binding protein [Sporosarcina sp. G11-34]MCZ2258965.1 biotin/lipoyl-binding protein [Sporosarcina sp. G11-34]
MKKKVWIWVIAILVVLGIAAAIIWSLNNKKVHMMDDELGEMSTLVQKASEELLTESILVTGKIVPEGEQKVFLEPEKGEVLEYKVTENQQVLAGDVLFEYDSSKLKVEYGKAIRERDLIQKRAKIEQSQIAAMEKQIAATKKKVGVKKDPDESGYVEPSVTQADVNALAAEKVQLEIQYEGTKSEITSAQEQINELDTLIKEMVVVSKIDGIVVKVDQNIAKTETGSTDPAIHIISSGPFKVIGTMSEFDTVKIQTDQAVVIRPKVFKDKEWNGVVESVSQFPNEEGGEDYGGGGGNVTMYPFKVSITDDTSELRQGFHVSLEINVGGNEKSLVVPHMALLDEGDSTAVFVLVDGFLERREVQTGAMNDEYIEITEGVELGELVVIAPDEGMHDGMEVVSFDEIE